MTIKPSLGDKLFSIAKHNKVILAAIASLLSISIITSAALATAPPTAPQNLTATQSGTGQVTATWTPPANDFGSPVTGYKLEYLPHGYGTWIAYKYDGWSTTMPAGTSSAVFTLPGDTYDIRVRAVNSFGDGANAVVTDVEPGSRYSFDRRIPRPDATGRYSSFAFNSDGSYYAVDTLNDRVDVYNASGTKTGQLGGPGTGPGQFGQPYDIKIGPSGNLYISDPENSLIHVFSPAGSFLFAFGGSGTADGQFESPTFMAFDSTGTLFVVDAYASVQKFMSDGQFVGRFATDIGSPLSIAIDSQDNVFIHNDDYPDYGVLKYTADGTNLGLIIPEGDAPGQTYSVNGMAINSNDELIMSDSWNYRVQITDNDGNFLERYGTGYAASSDYLGFSLVDAISIDQNGNLYVSDAGADHDVIVFKRTYAETSTVPGSPENVTASSSTPGQIDVAWQPPQNNGKSPILSYKVEHKKSSGSNSTWVSEQAAANSNSHVIENLETGTYDVRVSSENKNGPSLPVVVPDIAVIASGTVPGQDKDPGGGSNPKPTPSPSPTPAPSPSPTPLPAPSPTKPIASGETDTNSNTAPTSDNTNPDQPIDTVVDDSTGEVEVSWDPPTGLDEDPIGYVVEVSDPDSPASSQPDSGSESMPDTPSGSDVSSSEKTWEQVAEVGPDERSVKIALPSGKHEIRVAALLPGEAGGATKVILGVATVRVNDKVSVQGDGHIPATEAASDKDRGSLGLWLSICAGLVMSAFFWIIVAWKRRKKKQQEAYEQLPPRWQ